MEGIAYSFSPDTGEDTGPVPAQVSPAEPSKLLRPLNASFVPGPACEDRQIAVFAAQAASPEERNLIAESGADAWGVQHDWRAVPLFRTADGARADIEQIGEVPGADVTEQPRPSLQHTWQNGAWALDPARVATAVRLERDGLLGTAQLRISPLQDAADLGVASGEELTSLTAWKTYRIALMRIEQQSGFPLAISWPPQPG